ARMRGEAMRCSTGGQNPLEPEGKLFPKKEKSGRFAAGNFRQRRQFGEQAGAAAGQRFRGRVVRSAGAERGGEEGIHPGLRAVAAGARGEIDEQRRVERTPSEME